VIERDLAQLAVDTALQRGATYADARIIRLQTEQLDIRNGNVNGIKQHLEVGIGIRVLVDGAWGFAANPDLKKSKVEIAVDRAIALARDSAHLYHKPVVLARRAPIVTVWKSPCEIDPFGVALEEKLNFLFAAEEEMRRVKGIAFTEAGMDLWKEWQLFVNSDGSQIEQEIIQTGSGLSATAVSDTDVQSRSFPSSFGGQFKSAGYELIPMLNLKDNAQRIAEEAVQLLSAKACPAGEKTLILGGSQLALQVHESCGHPVEFDRVLGHEADFAGTSFLTPEKRNNFQYGSEIVNMVADATAPGGLGTFGYDDEGTPAQKSDIIKDGKFVGYLMSRETAEGFEMESNGTMRAQGWNHTPIVRMTNINLLPGNWELEEMIASTEDGIMISDNRSWSIDDKRLNFQFGGELGWEIKGGKIVGMVKNPTYTGITPQFWRSCDAIANQNHYQIWGTPNCGKGQPMQVARVGHGVSFARFQNVKVGVGYAE
jgi:TldD protein